MSSNNSFMGAANNSFRIVGGSLIEIGRLDRCGLPVQGSNSVVRTKGAMQLDLTPDTDQGTDLFERNMDGGVCINDKDCVTTKGMNAKLKMCAFDPIVLELLVGATPIRDEVDPLVIRGFNVKGESRQNCNKFWLKLWSVPSQGCSDGGNPYVLWGFSLAENAHISNTFTFAHRQHVAVEVDFYIREGNAMFVDPMGHFKPSDLSDHLYATKEVASIPEPTAIGTYLQ